MNYYTVIVTRTRTITETAEIEVIAETMEKALNIGKTLDKSGDIDDWRTEEDCSQITDSSFFAKKLDTPFTECLLGPHSWSDGTIVGVDHDRCIACGLYRPHTPT